MTIHGEHPFLPAPEERDPVRRFRGRLAAPVTIVTAGESDQRTGLTVSSLFVIEGDPGLVQAVVSPSSDLWDLVAETGRFVVHVCRNSHRHLADVFAGIRPSPGGMFVRVDITDSDWGPVLTDLEDRAYCTLVGREEVGYAGVVRGLIDRVEVTGTTDPLVYFRGRYHDLG
jgi:3-hydroxy-9,10-secoandrosta-1,3,5(10)-triene-9,17-dione monooxygenase reductase component